MGFPMFKDNFEPTFYEDRLKEPFKIKKPSTIFVGSMSDVFGDWVKVEWIEQIIDVARKCQRHRFLFLTKNGLRMSSVSDLRNMTNAWCGQTCTGISTRTIWDIPTDKNFLSFEPLLGDWLPSVSYPFIRWIIIGALNNGKNPVPPDNGGTKKEWVLSLLEQANTYKIPVFIKDSLYKLYPNLPVKRELPYLA